MSHKVLFCLLITLFSLKLISCQIDGAVCNEQNQGRHFPSGINCSLYYTCFDREFHLQQCPSGFWFDYERQVCDFYQNVNCDSGPSDRECTAENDGMHYPSNRNCSSYYTCFGGQFHLQNCPSGFWFVFERQSCISCGECIENDECFVDTITTTPIISTTTQIPTECPPNGIAKIADQFSCTRYFLCFSSIRVERFCSPGLFFSRSQSRCVRRDESDCDLKTNICPSDNDPNNVIFLPNQEDCQKYFICYDGEPQEFDCGPSLHWDPNSNWCIKQEYSNCEPSYVLPDIREIDCPETSLTELLFLPHPENCQFYFICFNMQSFLLRCSRNLLFDHIMGECYFRDSARCFTKKSNTEIFLNKIK